MAVLGTRITFMHFCSTLFLTMAQSPAARYYLLAYNVVSCLGWAYIFTLVAGHLANQVEAGVPPSPSKALWSFFAPFLKNTSFATWDTKLPPWAMPLYRRATTTYSVAGWSTAIVQTGAALEVAHVALGLVRSPIGTTAMQVASRLFLVWGITERFEVVWVSRIRHVDRSLT